MATEPGTNQCRLQYVELVGCKLVLYFETDQPQPDELRHWVRRISEHLLRTGFRFTEAKLLQQEFTERPGTHYALAGIITTTASDAADRRFSMSEFQALRTMLDPNRTRQGTISFKWEGASSKTLQLVGYVRTAALAGFTRRGSEVSYGRSVRVQIVPLDGNTYRFALPLSWQRTRDRQRVLAVTATVADHLGIFVKGDIHFDLSSVKQARQQ